MEERIALTLHPAVQLIVQESFPDILDTVGAEDVFVQEFHRERIEGDRRVAEVVDVVVEIQVEEGHLVMLFPERLRRASFLRRE